MKKKFDIEKLEQTETSVSSFVDSPIKKSVTRRKESDVDKVFKEMKANPFIFYIRVPYIMALSDASDILCWTSDDVGDDERRKMIDDFFMEQAKKYVEGSSDVFKV